MSARPALLEAATRVVLAQGGAALTLDAVAREAGVSKGGLLYHFPSKNALIGGLVAHLTEAFDAALAAAEAQEQGPGRHTRAWLTVASSPQVAAVDAATAGLVAAVAEAPALLQPLRDAYQRWDARMADDGLDPVDAALVRLTLDGLWMARVAGLPEPPPEVLSGLLGRLRLLAGGPERRGKGS